MSVRYDSMESAARPPYAGTGPVNGDVVVAPQPATGGRFLLGQFPRAPVLILSSKRKALDLGARFARLHAVDLWLTEGAVVTRLESRRPLCHAGPSSEHF